MRQLHASVAHLVNEGFAIETIFAIKNPETVLEIRVMALEELNERICSEMSRNRFYPEHVVDYQSIENREIAFVRVFFIKRKSNGTSKPS